MSGMLALLCLLLCTTQSSDAAGIYKWVDENGQVHFSQTKPNQHEAHRIGDTMQSGNDVAVPAIGRCQTLAEQLVGDWRGQDKQQRIVFRFYDDDMFFDNSTTSHAFMIDYGRQGQLQGGHWKLKGSSIIFVIKKRGHVKHKRPYISRALVGKIDADSLTLLLADESLRLTRYRGSGNLPRCMRRKH
jgi:hypothetical protein